MLSEAAKALWAKSPKLETDPPDGHSVIAHLLDVAACAWEILEREPVSTIQLFAIDFGLELDQTKPWVCALVGLHDLGKASPAFQQKWEGGRERVKEYLPWNNNQTKPPDDVPHSAVSQLELCRLLPTRGWSLRAARLAADAVGAHHGWRVEAGLLGKADTRAENGGVQWANVRTELFEAVLEALNIQSTPNSDFLTAGAFQRLAGLTSFADWIGSSLPFAQFEAVETYFLLAKKRARIALDKVGWSAREPLIDKKQSLEKTFSYLVEPEAVFYPRALQIAIVDLLKGVTSPTLLIVEAPMGEGKTELALYAHLELQRLNGHRGMYVALPTQATGNAMFNRTQDFLKQFGEARASRLDLQLLHGATLLKAEYQDIVIKDIADKPEELVVARAYFSHRKRALLSEYGVGTVDQALLGVLNVKHQFVRLWGLGNRVVVLDEVHAYDTYTGSLIETLVQWLFALGSSVIVMSATLPAKKRIALLEAFGSENHDSKPYPRITKVSSKKTTCVHVPASGHKTVFIKPLNQEDEVLADTLLELTKVQGCAVFISNTVDRAQRLYRLLKDNEFGTPVLLFHARFPVAERQKREQACLEAFSKKGSKANPNRPVKAILIATQVVEQSLDLDFDLMISDLAPIDLLLQRAGRLHRHSVNDGNRGIHTEPVLFIAGLTDATIQPDLETNHWQFVYAKYILLRTWQALAGTQQLEFPDDIDTLVQLVYGDTPLGELNENLKQILEKAHLLLLGEEDRNVIDATQAVIGNPQDTSWEDPTRGFRSSTEDEVMAGTKRVSTRKGEESITVVPIFKIAGAFYLDSNATKPVSDKARLDLEAAKEIYAQSVRLGRKAIVYGIEQHVKQHFKSLPWQETPLLQGMMPLILEGGIAQFGKTLVRLDSEEGVVYEK